MKQPEPRRIDTKSRKLIPSMTLLLLACTTTASRGDEGMWLLNDLPTQLLKDRHNFVPSEEWSRHLMLSSVRFSSGGSASFVSSGGLVLTNQHVAADTLHKLSTAENNYYNNGFLARTPAEELKAPDLELNQLVSIDDVTEQVNAAMEPDMDANEAYKARQAAMANIEQASLEATGLRSDVVTLYGGAKYHLYRYKKYTDVRLVWAPEGDIAHFGGDPDNFEYPRYCLDVAIFRVYENGKPIEVEHFLEWSENGLTDGELVFVSGNPGNTQRSTTAAALKYLRDRHLPYLLNYFCRMEITLQQFGNESPEQSRRASKDLASVQNARKALTGMLQGLQSPQFMAKKEQREEALRSKLREDPEIRHYEDAWKKIASLQDDKEELLGRIPDFRSRYYQIAKDLVLMTTEDQKPSDERLREYRDSARESLEHTLFSSAPIYDDLEIAKLAAELSMYVERWGMDDPLAAALLAGDSPREKAAELIQRSELNDVEFRRNLAEGGPAAVHAAEDPLIQWFLAIEPEYRRLRELQDELDELQRQAYAEIDAAKLAVEGTSGYPDATFTLRLALGIVKGYQEEGRSIPPWTTIGGAYDHEAAHDAKDPWLLPKSWHEARNEVDLDTPLNFVSTADIIGGNSGSPVVNRDGQLVGVIFDSNIQGLTASYFYDDETARAVSVCSSAVREALRNVYHANELARQLGR